MRLHKQLMTLGLLTGVALTGSSPLLAQTRVRQLDADTLLVELQYGKPPHGRMLIERTDNPDVFATYDAMRTHPRRTLFAGVFGGAPGKNSPFSQIRGFDAVEETTEFAQFEETTANDTSPVQHWHGAPGKGLPTAR